jgi:hypothetical protein
MTFIDAVMVLPKPLDLILQDITIHRYDTSRRYGCQTYKFADDAAPFLERHGWKLVRQTHSYAHMEPPTGMASVPKEVPVSVEIPDLGDLERFADACHADALPARGVVGPWKWEYQPARQSVSRCSMLGLDGLTRLAPKPFTVAASFDIGVFSVWHWYKRWDAPSDGGRA